MTERSEPGKQLAKFFSTDITEVEGFGLRDPEFIYRPHSELIERHFQALNTAYEKGNMQAYRDKEAEFVRQFGQFWSDRVQRYSEAVAEEKMTFIAGRLFIQVGAEWEEMGISRPPWYLWEEGMEGMSIFRCEEQTRCDSLNIIRVGDSTRMILETTLPSQEDPLPYRFNLELRNGSIQTFDRTTARYYGSRNDGHAFMRTKSLRLGFARR